MRWDPGHQSRDVIDRRGEGGGGGPNIGGLLPLIFFLLRTPFGWVILLVLGGVFVVSRLGLFSGGDTSSVRGRTAEQAKMQDQELVHFVSFVLDDTQATWDKTLPAQTSKPYRHAKLVLFTDATSTACGYGQAATGPFYCPADERVYIDLGFYRELSQKLGARGELAQAYVIAHEIGHHVQKILGTSERVHNLRGSTEGAGGASVRLELQADCYAGIWAHSTAQRNLLEQGDLESALNAAQAIGDDRLQRMSTGTVSPERWTHGSSEQRMRWFRRGYENGQVADCDTFKAATL
jgi:predicted metalloprotease